MTEELIKKGHEVSSMPLLPQNEGYVPAAMPIISAITPAQQIQPAQPEKK